MLEGSCATDYYLINLLKEMRVNELVMHHLLSSSSALFRRLHASSTVDPMQLTVVSST